MLIAIPFRLHSGGIDALASQRVHHTLCPCLGEGLIGIRIACVVGVTADLHVHVGISLQDFGDILQLLFGRRLQRGLAGVES